MCVCVCVASHLSDHPPAASSMLTWSPIAYSMLLLNKACLKFTYHLSGLCTPDRRLDHNRQQQYELHFWSSHTNSLHNPRWPPYRVLCWGVSPACPPGTLEWRDIKGSLLEWSGWPTLSPSTSSYNPRFPGPVYRSCAIVSWFIIHRWRGRWKRQHNSVAAIPTHSSPLVYSIKPTPVPRSTPVCEIYLSDSADMGVKVADPAVISLWKALKKFPPLGLPYPKFRPVITSLSEFHPVMAAAPEPSFKMAIAHETSSKMAAAHVPLVVLVEYDGMSWSPDMAPVPELSLDLTSTLEYNPMKTTAPKCSPESAAECSPELNREPTHITEFNQEPSSPSSPLVPSNPPLSPESPLSPLVPSSHPSSPESPLVPASFYASPESHEMSAQSSFISLPRSSRVPSSARSSRTHPGL